MYLFVCRYFCLYLSSWFYFSGETWLIQSWFLPFPNPPIHQRILIILPPIYSLNLAHSFPSAACRLHWGKRAPECGSLFNTHHWVPQGQNSKTAAHHHKLHWAIPRFYPTPGGRDCHWDSEGGRGFSNSSFCQKRAEWESETRPHPSWGAGK